MSVNPLDLQVNFTQMNQVGKQQSMQKDSEVLRQDQASQMVNKEGEKDAEYVPETKDLSEGPGKVKDKEEKNNKRNKNKNSEKSVKEENDEEIDESKNLKDPDLGQKIDIMG